MFLGMPLRLVFQLSDHLRTQAECVSQPRRTLVLVSPLRAQTRLRVLAMALVLCEQRSSFPENGQTETLMVLPCFS